MGAMGIMNGGSKNNWSKKSVTDKNLKTKSQNTPLVTETLVYGEWAFCYDCGALGEKVGAYYGCMDVLHCTKCHAEWIGIKYET